jgi:hypothetical protein
MGYYVNKSLVVSGTYTKVKKANEKAKKIYFKHFKDEFPNQNISDVIGGYCNCVYSFFIASDGSKFLFDTYVKSEKSRNDFINWLEKEKIDYAFVSFGGDSEQKNVE